MLALPTLLDFLTYLIMTFWHAIILGIVQGLTEFLPVSSTAHLYITMKICGLSEENSTSFIAIIQLGTLVAVIWYFWRDICEILREWFMALVNGKPFSTHLARQGWFMIVATVPIIVFALLFKEWIKGPLHLLVAICIQMTAGSLLMLGAELYFNWRQKRHLPAKDMTQIGAKETIGVGLFQCLALLPGMSRSGSTISGGLILGLTRETAARFSFLLSLPAVFAAGVYSLWSDAVKPWYKGDDEFGLFSTSTSVQQLLISTVVSGIVGYFTIGFLINYLKRHSVLVFIVYRLIVAAALLYAVYWLGWK